MTMEFHFILAEMCGNRFLEGLVRSTIDLTRRIVEAADVAYDHSTEEHGPIMEAVLSGNSEAAREAMKKHAVTNGESLMKTERLSGKKAGPPPSTVFRPSACFFIPPHSSVLSIL